MHMVLSLVPRDQWTAQKVAFWAYYIYFVNYSGSAQSLSQRPIIKPSIWCLQEKRNEFRNESSNFRCGLG